MNREECRAHIESALQIIFDDPVAGADYAKGCIDLVSDLGHPPDLHARALTIFGTSRMALGQAPL